MLVAASFILLGAALLARDSWWLLRLFPVTDLILWGDLTPLAAGAIAGIALSSTLPRWRRWTVGLLLLAIADAVAWGHLVKPTPETIDEWDCIACLQTTESTCAPAAAATLLGLHGIAGDEGALASACRTTDAGTTRWGLWRGLRITTAGSPWEVVASDPPIEEVLGRGPAIVSVSLTAELDAQDPRYRREWGWGLGQPHAVVYLGPGDRSGSVRIADPKLGIEQWDEAGLRALWNRQVFRLLPRPRNSPHHP